MATFKVMTWNVENLYPVGSASGPKTSETYEKKLSSLAEVILSLDPDVLALQEIGSPESFNDLNERLENKYPHFQLSKFPDTRGIRVGFLSKLEIQDSEDISQFPASGLVNVPGIDKTGEPELVSNMSRGILRILVNPQPGFPVHLMNTHLKSKLLSFPTPSGKSQFSTKDEDLRARVAGFALIKRTAEAITLRVKATELLKGNASQGLIVLGDLNDVPDAATTQILKGPPGSDIGTGGFPRPDQGDDTRLWNLATLIPTVPKNRQYSRIHDGKGELIDHIFVSQELLAEREQNLPVVDSHIDIFNGLPSIDENPENRRGKPGSDHSPITALFDF